jgi:5'-3' exonuclease
MLDILYTSQLCIYDWPAGVPPPGPDFDLKSLSASQLHALVVPYLRMHLLDMYEAEECRDEDEDNTDVEAAKTTKRKGKSKKRIRGVVVEEPNVVLSIKEWTSSAFPGCPNHT